MSIRVLVPLTVAVLVVISNAADGPIAIREPDHLVPVAPYPGASHIRYTDQLQSRLKLDTFCFAQMVVKPSFSGEYAVRLHGQKDDYDVDQTEKFFVTYSAANKSIWYSLPENNDSKKQQEVKVETRTVEVPKPLATRVYQAWRKVLLQTRYPQEPSGGLDGVTYEFAAYGLYGETWSPQEHKSPRFLIELGESLVEYCKAAPADRGAAERKVEDKVVRLDRYLKDSGSK